MDQTPPSVPMVTEKPITAQKKNNLLPIVAVIAVIAIGFIAYGLLIKKPETAILPKTTNEQTVADYKNGTYSAVGDYTSPGGPEQIEVKITLENGVITQSQVIPKAQRPNSVKFQNIFADNYKSFVHGKNIDEVILDKVSGSSLSPKGFNDALEKIKQQAKS